MTIELTTGIDRPANPLDYITKEAGTHLAPPGTPHPLWTAFLNRVTGNNDTLIGFLQRFLGYCMTGFVHEHVFAFLYGTGDNGKTTFVETVAGIFGNYCITAPMDMFLTAKYDRHPTEIARLKGVRLVVADETTKGRAWDEAKIKNLTGGGTLTARFMRGNFFDFKPTHKLLVAGNNKPALRNVDQAIRRRILLVPFTVRIPEAERDKKLGEKLEAEWPAILRWILDGCLEWQKVGLVVPTIVRDATDAYLADQDSISQWADECVEKNPAVEISTTKVLFASWKIWCGDRNLSPGTERDFTDTLAGQLGWERNRKTKARGFKGVALKRDNGPERAAGLEGMDVAEDGPVPEPIDPGPEWMRRNVERPAGNSEPSLASWEINGLVERGWTRSELFDDVDNNAQKYRNILADPRYERMRERFTVGAKTAEPCSWCDKGGNVNMITGTDARGRQRTAALHLKHAPDWFEQASSDNLEDSPDDAPSNSGNEGTSASVAEFNSNRVMEELRYFGCTEEYIRDVLPADAQKFLAERRKLAAVLTAWFATLGANQPCTTERLMAAGAGGKLKTAILAATNGRPLDEWLTENTSVEVGQLTLREAGTDKDGRPQWTLELRVEPDKGSNAD